MADKPAEENRSSQIVKAKSFFRRDYLIDIEKKVQQAWAEAKIYESDPVEDQKGDENEKFMATFPYPYMNGVLHLGHAFTLTKAEFSTRYQRLKGKTVLFPFGFHCTGMPIAACANKLKREFAEHGNPAVLPPMVEEPEPVVEAKVPEKKDKKKTKGKLAKKKSKFKRQYDIMKEMGVPEEEITKFQDSNYWLTYFPPIAMDHLTKFGLAADFRRAFITTEINPYYDAFIRWQFNTLKELGKVYFGTRNAIFSPIDDQVCADHDRSKGEKVLPQDYTLIKLKLTGDMPAQITEVVKDGQNVFMPAATLRPETMYGQTNCFVLPEGKYGIYQMKDEKEVFICSERSALNMSYQLMTPTRGKPTLLGTVMGTDLIGCAVSAPLATYEKVYVLPLLTIKMNKGTGIVTSVPSDAPADYAALMDFKNKPQFREKYGITEDMVLPFEVVPIIDTPGLGSTPAKDLCIKMKVKSQNDTAKIDQIKDKVYLESFTKGKMLVGDHKGESVQKAKPLIKQWMIENGTAAAYAEPESLVVARSGNECVVAATDQWYMAYGEDQWKAQVLDHITNRLETFNHHAKSQFESTVGWLHEWACSRNFGLGTFLPWDPKYVIESLSDSTIYMAYYTIAHHLQGGVLDGSVVGPAGIKAEQLSDAVFDYIFTGKAYPADCGIEESVLAKLRKEFLFWYPLDLRVSGKDLIGNHLTMSLYNHAAIWPEEPEMWPRSYFTNGHVMVNHQKMSKSEGNFYTMMQCVEKFSADATRFSLADAGDGLDDANFEEDTVNSAILKLTKEEAWFDEILKEELRAGPPSSFIDLVFNNQMNKAIQAAATGYENMKFHDALVAFHSLCHARDFYRVACDGPLNKELVERFMEVFAIVLSPICPHFCQHLWEKTGHTGFIFNARWPVCEPEDIVLTRKAEYLTGTVSNINSLYKKKVDQLRKLAKKKKLTGPLPKMVAMDLYVANAYPDWQHQIIEFLSKIFSETGALPHPNVIAKSMRDLPCFASDKKLLKKGMQFVGFLKKDVDQRGAAALELKMPFDEKVLLNENMYYLNHSLSDIKTIRVADWCEETLNPTGKGQSAIPGAPIPYYRSEEDEAARE